MEGHNYNYIRTTRTMTKTSTIDYIGWVHNYYVDKHICMPTEWQCQLECSEGKLSSSL